MRTKHHVIYDAAGAVVGVIAAAFAVLFMKIHHVFEKLVSSLGLHVSHLPPYPRQSRSPCMQYLTCCRMKAT